MPDNIDPRSVNVSIKIYERLLATYPAAFRREYGQAMKQLFRDQCRDAWTEAGSRGLALLWLRVLADWVKTSVVEHLSNLNERKFLFMKTLRAISADPRLRAPFFRVFAVVFIPAIACSLLVVFCSPRVYSSTVRIEVAMPRNGRLASPLLPDAANSNGDVDSHHFMINQCKIIESYHVLTNVIADLKLNKTLPEQLDKQPWTTDNAYTYLAKMVNVEQTPMTSLIEINVKNPNPLLAANIANEIAYRYQEEKLNEYREEIRKSSVSNIQPESNLAIVRDPARPESKPVFPNLRVIIISILGGTLLALFAGGIAALVGMVSRASRPSHTQAGG